MATKISQSRQLAYDALERIRKSDSFANDVIDKLIDGSDASLEDKAFATRIVLGVVAASGALDLVINRFVDKRGSLKGKLRTALRISTYEIIYLHKDSYAAVDQCVELAKTVQPRAAGLANAVMRRIAQSSSDFPYGDAKTDIKAYSLLHAFPEWLVDMAMREFGECDGDEFVRANNAPSPIYIHVNSLKEDEDGFSKASDLFAGSKSVEIDSEVVEGCCELTSSKLVASTSFLDLVAKGRILVSDASAQFISQLACEAVLNRFQDRPVSCLELCAGRGTKTILLQSYLKRLEERSFAKYVAIDNIEFKLRLLKTRAKEYGAKVDELICADAANLSELLGGECFELVFLDAPCSGLGTMRRHPEIRWRVTPEVIEENSILDGSLIRQAAEYVVPGGILVYATCTISDLENEQVVEHFLNSNAGKSFELIPISDKPFLRTMLREGGYDSHFCAILGREALR